MKKCYEVKGTFIANLTYYVMAETEEEALVLANKSVEDELDDDDRATIGYHAQRVGMIDTANNVPTPADKIDAEVYKIGRWL